MKKAIKIGFVLIFLFVFAFNTYAGESYHNYAFDYWTVTPNMEPQAYVTDEVITADRIGTEPLQEPKDLFVAENGNIYVADTGNNRILIMDSKLQLIQEISQFQLNGKTETFSSPSGLFVTKDGTLYIADTINARIVKLTGDYSSGEVFNKPDSVLIDDNFQYAPLKLVVDNTGKMYVVSENEIKGALLLDVDGTLISFFGAVKTVPNLVETFWRMIATEEQLATMSQNVPTNYSNLDIDDKGFIYSTVATIDTTQNIDDSIFVRKLNSMGIDVLKRNDNTPIIGDWTSRDATGQEQTSELCDVVYVGDGIYSVLGRKESRVYTYDSNGNLIYVFGSKGETKGQLGEVSALDYLPDGRYLVLDAKLNQIVIYKPTEYANLIYKATVAFNNSEYEKSEQLWNQAMDYTTKSDIVYDDIGRAALRNSKYGEAMEYFKLSHNQTMYSQAFKYYRNAITKMLFPYILAAVAVIVIGVFVWKQIKKRRPVAASGPKRPESLFLSNVKYAKRVVFRPFDGFWCLKRERTQTFWPAMLFLGITALSVIARALLTGFIFNMSNMNKINIIIEICNVVLPFFIWCLSNWCITTLVDGEGSFKDIAVTTSYALLPWAVSNFVLVILSHYLTMEEAGLYTLISSIGLIWSGLLLFVGIMTIHQFSIPKTIITIVIAVIGMAIIILIVLLLFSMIQQLLGFTSIVYREIAIRR